jgi:nitrilase
MEGVVKVACVQAEPIAFEREATIDKLEKLVAEVAGEDARLALFPETFIPVYPSSRWVRYLAGWSGDGAGDARDVFARLARQSVTVPGPDSDRLAEIARTHGVWLAVGANELERGTIYNSLLVYSPAGELALHHRKLMPTNHERLVWGLGDGKGLETVSTDFGNVGGLICWENLMPLARAALYEDGVEIYLAPTADDSEEWHDSMRHIARESRSFVLSCCVFQRASSYPHDVPLAEGDELVGSGGSAILAPDGSYLAGPLWNEEGILYAELDPQQLYRARQRFDPAGHYSRPDLLKLQIGS